MKTKQKQNCFGAIKLPKPVFKKGCDVFKAMKNRKTTREISSKKLPVQELSNILWSAGGVNRTKGPFNTPGITAASASNSQEILIYAAMQEGIYRYEPKKHELIPALAGDYRKMGIGRGQGNMGADAPLRLIYVVDMDKLEHTAGFDEPGLHDHEVQKSYYFTDTGMAAQNVYICAASQGLAAWFHNCDRQGLSAKLGLSSGRYRVVFGQTVGFAK